VRGEMVEGIERIVEEEDDEMISCLVLNAGVLLPVLIYHQFHDLYYSFDMMIGEERECRWK